MIYVSVFTYIYIYIYTHIALVGERRTRLVRTITIQYTFTFHLRRVHYLLRQVCRRAAVAPKQNRQRRLMPGALRRERETNTTAGGATGRRVFT